MASSASSAPSRPTARPSRLGLEVPRLYTPPLGELTPETSLGFSLIEFADEVLGISLLPWQRWLVIHALELGLDGTLRFRNIVVLVARQNGKSTVSQVLALWWLYVCGCRTVLGTAQDLDTATEVWGGCREIIDSVPELAELADKPVLINGKQSIRLLTGERYRVKAANRRAGRGLTGNRIMLDELREHQSWDAWGAITKTTMAIADAQVWCFSNAGDMTSVVLRYLRKLAHDALGDPDGINAADANAGDVLPGDAEVEAIEQRNDEIDDLEVSDLEVDVDDLFLAEWSAVPGCDIWDRDQWAQANPSLGYTITERTVASAARTDPEWVMRTEVLCQWSEGGLVGPFPAGSWGECAAGKGTDGRLLPAERLVTTARVTACMEVARDRGSASIGVAGHRADGRPQVEVIAHRTGVGWVVDWFTDPAHPERARWEIALRQGSPGWTLRADLVDAGLDVVEWKSQDVGVGCGALYDDVRIKTLRHTDQPVLNVPAETAITKPLERGLWVWDGKRSPHDTAALYAVTGAHWLLNQTPETPPPAPPPPRAVISTLPTALSTSDVARAQF